MNAGSYSGSYLVADTGGAVKGRKLDIWVPSCSEARRFGRRTVMVALASKKK
jgi:3D (Asp-Asp-Asp) domain-containing protein